MPRNRPTRRNKRKGTAVMAVIAVLPVKLVAVLLAAVISHRSNNPRLHVRLTTGPLAVVIAVIAVITRLIAVHHG